MCINYNKMEFVLETAGKDSMFWKMDFKDRWVHILAFLLPCTGQRAAPTTSEPQFPHFPKAENHSFHLIKLF